MSGIFVSLFNIINEHICGGVLTIDQVIDFLPITVGLICMAGCICVVALPFLAVTKFCSVIFGSFGSNWGFR